MLLILKINFLENEALYNISENIFYFQFLFLLKEYYSVHGIIIILGSICINKHISFHIIISPIFDLFSSSFLVHSCLFSNPLEFIFPEFFRTTRLSYYDSLFWNESVKLSLQPKIFLYWWSLPRYTRITATPTVISYRILHVYIFRDRDRGTLCENDPAPVPASIRASSFYFIDDETKVWLRLRARICLSFDTDSRWRISCPVKHLSDFRSEKGRACLQISGRYRITLSLCLHYRK